MIAQVLRSVHGTAPTSRCFITPSRTTPCPRSYSGCWSSALIQTSWTLTVTRRWWRLWWQASSRWPLCWCALAVECVTSSVTPPCAAGRLSATCDFRKLFGFCFYFRLLKITLLYFDLCCLASRIILLLLTFRCIFRFFMYFYSCLPNTPKASDKLCYGIKMHFIFSLSYFLAIIVDIV